MLILIIIIVLTICFLIVYRQFIIKNKYQNITYLNSLEQISLFFDTIQKFDDYVTWVQRDQIKKQFSVIICVFVNKKLI